MINRLLKWLFAFDRFIRERRQRAIADQRSIAVITKNMEEIAKEQGAR